MNRAVAGIRSRLAAGPPSGWLRSAQQPCAARPAVGTWLARSYGCGPACSVAGAAWQSSSAPAARMLVRDDALPAVGAQRRCLSSAAGGGDDAVGSFSAMSVVAQRIDGVRWRVFGSIPDHVGTPGTKKLRKKLSGPSVLSWCDAPLPARPPREAKCPNGGWLRAGTPRRLRNYTRCSTERRDSCGKSGESAHRCSPQSLLPRPRRAFPTARCGLSLTHLDIFPQAAARGEG